MKEQGDTPGGRGTGEQEIFNKVITRKGSISNMATASSLANVQLAVDDLVSEL